MSAAKGLISALGLGPREHIAIVGGGGKTSLCFALAEALRKSGKRVLTTTTTKVWHREACRAPRVVFSPFGAVSHEDVERGLDIAGHVFVARRLLGSGKMEGIDGAAADAFFRELHVDCVVEEADGAAGRPLKAPAAHEPVIPASASTVIAVMGLEALGRPLDTETVFRPGLFMALTGLHEGEILTPEGVARAFQGPRGLFKGAPDTARRTVFLNKLDLLTHDQPARALARLLVLPPSPTVERVVVGSLSREEHGVYVSENPMEES